MVDETRDHHTRSRSDAEAVLAQQDTRLVELRATVAELAARTLPDPPSQPWQRKRRPTCLADLVDFTDAVPDADRRGLEAAMVASGLLGAELDETARHMDGKPLRIAPDHREHRSPRCSRSPSLPPRRGGSARGRERVLRAHLQRPADSPADDRTVVTVDGRFRTGVLRGRHTVAVAEHIGVTARRAALERQRAQAGEELGRAEAERSRTVEAIATTVGALERLSAIRSTFPSTTSVVDAASRSEMAEQQLTARVDGTTA